MLAPRALILRGPGTNCDEETAHAFERAGGHTKRVHVQALAQSPSLLDDFQIFCIPGGFRMVMTLPAEESWHLN